MALCLQIRSLVPQMQGSGQGNTLTGVENAGSNLLSRFLKEISLLPLILAASVVAIAASIFLGLIFRGRSAAVTADAKTEGVVPTPSSSVDGLTAGIFNLFIAGFAIVLTLVLTGTALFYVGPAFENARKGKSVETSCSQPDAVECIKFAN